MHLNKMAFLTMKMKKYSKREGPKLPQFFPLNVARYSSRVFPTISEVVHFQKSQL